MRHALATSVAVLTAIDLLVAYLLVAYLLVAYLPLVGRERGLSPAFVGLLLSVRGLATLASRLALPVLMSSLGRRMTLGGNLFAAGLATVALGVATRPAVFLALMVVIGFGLGVGQPITASWVAGQAPWGPGGGSAGAAARGQSRWATAAACDGGTGCRPRRHGPGVRRRWSGADGLGAVDPAHRPRSLTSTRGWNLSEPGGKYCSPGAPRGRPRGRP
jgi:MFS family permease